MKGIGFFSVRSRYLTNVYLFSARSVAGRGISRWSRLSSILRS